MAGSALRDGPRWLAFACCVSLAGNSCAAAQTVLVNYKATGSASPPRDFLGVSLEKEMVLSASNGPDFITGNNTSLAMSLKRMGVKNLRVGGGTGNFLACPGPGWSHTGSYPCLPSYVPTTADINRFASLAVAVGVLSVEYMISMIATNTSEASAEAAAVLAAFAGTNITVYIQLGNEENQLGWSAARYINTSRLYIAAIRNTTSNQTLLFSGPEATFNPTWGWSIPAATGLALATFHHYPGWSSRKPYCSVPTILSFAESDYANLVSGYSFAGNPPRRITEVNSCYDSGKPGVSNAFASALWLLDYLHYMGKAGIAGVNVHWSSDRLRYFYNPLWPTASSRRYIGSPVAHAMTAFAMSGAAGLGGKYLKISVSDNAGGVVRAYAFRRGGAASTRFVLINRGLSTNCTVSMNKTSFSLAAKGWPRAMWLVARSPYSLNITEFGFAVPDAATGAPQWSNLLGLNLRPITSIGFFPDPDPLFLNVTLPPSSAILIVTN